MMRNDIKILRKLILDIAHYGQDANLQSIFSSVEILWTLYYEAMNYSLNNMNDTNRDVFILSKGSLKRQSLKKRASMIPL